MISLFKIFLNVRKCQLPTRGVSNVGDVMTSNQQNPHGAALTADDDAAPRHPPLLTTPSR